MVEVTVDASQLTDGASDTSIDVMVRGAGQEVRPADNSLSYGLQLTARANLQLLGYNPSFYCSNLQTCAFMRGKSVIRNTHGSII